MKLLPTTRTENVSGPKRTLFDARAANADEWLSEPELRDRLGYSRSTIRRLRPLCQDE